VKAASVARYGSESRQTDDADESVSRSLCAGSRMCGSIPVVRTGRSEAADVVLSAVAWYKDQTKTRIRLHG
jgi:hypothetical protein